MVPSKPCIAFMMIISVLLPFRGFWSTTHFFTEDYVPLWDEGIWIHSE